MSLCDKKTRGFPTAAICLNFRVKITISFFLLKLYYHSQNKKLTIRILVTFTCHYLQTAFRSHPPTFIGSRFSEI